LYWIKGNNEDFDVIAEAIAGRSPAPTLHYLPNGGPDTDGPGWGAGGHARVAARGAPDDPGAPATRPAPGRAAAGAADSGEGAAPWSEGRKAAGAALELGKSRDDKGRCCVRVEVIAGKGLANIDLFLTREAPRPFYPAGCRIDAGKTVLNDVLAAMKPRLHLF